MQIISKKITNIYPYSNNPRKNDQAVDAVANSIKEFGFKVPVVIDKNGEIIAGHTRYKAAKNMIATTTRTARGIRYTRCSDNGTSERCSVKGYPVKDS